MRILSKHHRESAALLGFGLMMLSTGCQPGDGALSESITRLGDTLTVFLGDFARQVLAAFLL